jgi:hypothetical protein
MASFPEQRKLLGPRSLNWLVVVLLQIMVKMLGLPFNPFTKWVTEIVWAFPRRQRRLHTLGENQSAERTVDPACPVDPACLDV